MSKQQRRKGNAKNASSASAHGYLYQGGESFVGLTPEMNIFEAASHNLLHQSSGINDETRIVMKKLTKKDCQTREKGLKELMSLINTETTSTETCYEHFCGLVPQLSTDGSPSVRLLTMKTISLFLAKLKKSASKGLKKIIPMVLFAKSDVTNGVAASATSVIREGFDVDKKQQIMQLFGPLTFEMAANIVQGKHDLSSLVEYDASEDKEARKSRLETQSLNVFLSLAKDFETESTIWEEHARRIFDNSEYIKKAFTGNKESLKVQLLNLCYRFHDNVEVILRIPQMLSYIQCNLDIQTFTNECATAWEGILVLLPSEKFQSKVSLQKGIFPRFLNVIRKKGNHWRVLKHYLLPAVSVLIKEMKKPDNDLRQIHSILDSFFDNLPWPTDASINAVHCWFNTFSDFVRWVLSNNPINLELWEVLNPLVLKFTEQSLSICTTEATECVTDLIHWIIDKNLLEANSLKFLTESIEMKIVEAGKEKSCLLKDGLTAPGRHISLSLLHANMISNPDLVDFNIVKNLVDSNHDYFDETINKIKRYSFIEDTGRFDASQSGSIVQFISMLLIRPTTQTLKVTVRNDHVGRGLLLSRDPKVWDGLLSQVVADVFQDMINYWHEKRNGKAIAEAVTILREHGIELDTDEAAGNVDFLISLLKKMKGSSTESNGEGIHLILKLFVALFELEEEPKEDHYENMALNLTANFNPDNFFENFLFNIEENDSERVIEISARFDKLIGLCEDQTRTQIVNNLLLTREKCNSFVEKLHFLDLELLASSKKSTVIITPLSGPVQHLDEHATKKMVTDIGRVALFNLASNHHTTFHQVFGWSIISAISCLEQRYCLSHLSEELQSLRNQIGKRLIRSGEDQLNLETVPLTNFLADAYSLSYEQEKQYIMMEENRSGLQHNEIKHILSNDLDPLEIMGSIFEASQTGNGAQLFQFETTNNYCWLVNLMFVKQFIQCGGQIFSAENLELRDFSLCGIVTVLDTTTDVLTNSPHAFEETPLLEALTALYMDLYLVLTNSIKSGNQSKETVEEWNEFYGPTIQTYFIRMFRTIRKDQQPTPFVRTLSNVLFSLDVFPNDVPNDNVTAREYVPELSVFKYSSFEESCISQAFGLLSSNDEHIQLLGYAVSRLLMPIMFNVENQSALKENDDTEVTVSNRLKLTLPVMLTKSYPVDHCHPHVGPLLLDLAMIPLETECVCLSQVQRVSYCDTIDPFIKNALNALMLDQPFEFRQIPIACRIPKSREREYYLQSDFAATPLFFDKFASRLLFKAITLLPAAVRLFYKGMPNCFMPVFQEVVTKYASRLLIENELSKVNETKFEGEMKVRTVLVTGQIIAEYVVEETKMKLTIELPPDYPLSVPVMNLDKAIVKNDRAKKWLMQLNAYLFHQNGAILEGIEMWKRNVDKGVEGVEDCTICMMTVHQQTHQLPKVKCKQCKNKFHSNCLYKWFESSNQSTCPLCRNNFT